MKWGRLVGVPLKKMILGLQGVAEAAYSVNHGRIVANRFGERNK
jgi:hypothetical protein